MPTLSRYAVPVMVRHGGSAPYDGTVIGGLPFPAELATPGSKIVAVDAQGKTLNAAYEVLGIANETNDMRWLLVAVTGRFDPGDTLLHVAVSDEPRDPYFFPPLYDLIGKAKVDVAFTIDGDRHQELLDFGDFGDFETLLSNGSLMRIRHQGDLHDKLDWELDVEARRGESGYRCELRLRNKTPDPFSKTEGEYIVFDDLTISVPTFFDEDQSTSVDIRRGAQDLGKSTQLGPLAIVKGDKKGPLQMFFEDNRAKARVIVGGDSAIPMRPHESNNYAQPARPGDPADTSTDDTTLRGLALRGGQTLAIQFWVGAPMDKENLDNPPMLTWANLQDYSKALVGGGSASAVQFSEPTRDRFEKHRLGLVDETVVDRFPGHDPNTYIGFRDRGGPYPKLEEHNPHFGVRDFGDTIWGDGYNGGNHYQMGTAKYLGFLQTGDMRFFEVAQDQALHLRTIDFIRSEEDSKYNGHFSYEKGWHHGNHSYCPPSHTWARSLCLEYVLTGNDHALDTLTRLCRWLVKYNTYDGDPVDPDWVAAGNDPKHWGVRSAYPGQDKPDNGGAKGYQGDQGIRSPARAISIAVDLQRFLGVDMSAYAQRVINNVLRIETGIWGRRGFILNRAARGNFVFDSEQGWMLAYLARAIGKAIQYGLTKDPEHTALYNRMVSFMVNELMAYGHSLPGKGTVPLRPVAFFNEDGPTTTIRPGISRETINKWYDIRENHGDDIEDRFAMWRRMWEADIETAIVQMPEYRHNPKVVIYRDAMAVVQQQIQATGAPDETSVAWSTLVSQQWGLLAQVAYPSTNYAALFADVFAQAFLAFNKQECGALALSLWQTSVWHLGDASRTKPYLNYQDDPTPIGYRMSTYPGSEEKVHGPQQDVMFMLELMEKFYPGLRPHYGIKDLQPKNFDLAPKSKADQEAVNEFGESFIGEDGTPMTEEEVTDVG